MKNIRIGFSGYLDEVGDFAPVRPGDRGADPRRRHGHVQSMYEKMNHLK